MKSVNEGDPELPLEGVRRAGAVDQGGEARRVQEADRQRPAPSLREAREGDSVGVDRRPRQGVVEAGQDVRLVRDAVGAVDVERRREAAAGRHPASLPEDEDGAPRFGLGEVLGAFELQPRPAASVQEEDRRKEARAVPRRRNAEVVDALDAVGRRTVGESEEPAGREGRRGGRRRIEKERRHQRDGGKEPSHGAHSPKTWTTSDRRCGDVRCSAR